MLASRLLIALVGEAEWHEPQIGSDYRGLLFVEEVVLPRARLRAAACFACLERADFEAADRGSRFSASVVARERLAEVLACFPVLPFSRSRSARLRVSSEVVPFRGGERSTPARRAFDNPMAIAC